VIYFPPLRLRAPPPLRSDFFFSVRCLLRGVGFCFASSGFVSPAIFVFTSFVFLPTPPPMRELDSRFSLLLELAECSDGIAKFGVFFWFASSYSLALWVGPYFALLRVVLSPRLSRVFFFINGFKATSPCRCLGSFTSPVSPFAQTPFFGGGPRWDFPVDKQNPTFFVQSFSVIPTRVTP